MNADPRAQRLAAALKAHDSLDQRVTAARGLADDHDVAATMDTPVARASANLLGAMGIAALRELCDDVEHLRRAEDAAHAHHIAAVREGLRSRQHAARLEGILRGVLKSYASADDADLERAVFEVIHVLHDGDDTDLHEAAHAAGLLAGGRECAAVMS